MNSKSTGAKKIATPFKVIAVLAILGITFTSQAESLGTFTHANFSGTLTKHMNSYLETISYSASSISLPMMMWMFLAGFVGLLGIYRRK